MALAMPRSLKEALGILAVVFKIKAQAGPLLQRPVGFHHGGVALAQVEDRFQGQYRSYKFMIAVDAL